MLQDIRDNSQGVIAKVIIGLIVAVFALFGVESIIGGFITSPPVAEVNGEEITEAQLQFSTQSLLATIGGGAELDQSLVEQIALNQLIEETLLQQSANRADMLLSSDRIDRSILDNPSFQINGVFDPDLAVRTMASQGYNAPLYRESLSRTMMMGQIANAFTSSSFITDAELEAVARLTQQTRDFRYVSVTLGTRTLGNPISDEEIANYYESNLDEFTQEETVVIEYVSLDKDLIAEEITIDEAELLAQYEAERDAFEGGAEKRASHILFEVPFDQSPDAALATAAEVKQRIDAGEDFGELALEFSIDTFSAQQGGDIGYTDGTVFPEAVEAALAEMSLNEVSEPIASEFGVHIVKLTEDAERVFESFEVVSARLERDLKSAEVDLMYAVRLEDLSNLAFESGDLSSISEELDLEIQVSEPVGRLGGSGIFSDPSLVAEAFSDSVLLEGNNSDPIELANEAIVLRVAQFNEAAALPLEEVEAEIAVILRTELEREAVQAIGDELLAAAESGEGLDALIEENELAWVEAPATNRVAFDVNREVVEHVFTLPEPAEGSTRYSNLTLSNDTFVLVELQAVTPGSLADMDEASRTSMVNAMKADLGNSDFTSYLLNLRETADISAPMLEEDVF